MWELAFLIIVLMNLSETGTMACFLEGPLVISWTFLFFLLAGFVMLIPLCNTIIVRGSLGGAQNTLDYSRGGILS